MIRQTNTSRNRQTQYIRNADQKAADHVSPDPLHQYDHLIPPMKKVLKFTAKATWFMMKTLVRAAFHLPALMRKTTPHPKPQTTAKTPSKKLPSPETAFPAP